MSGNISLRRTDSFEMLQKRANTEVLSKLITDRNILMPRLYLHFKERCVPDIWQKECFRPVRGEKIS